MKMITRLLVLTFFLTMIPIPADPTGALGRSQRITGVVDRLIEINRQQVIENVDPDTVGLPRRFIIDLQQRTMRGTPDSLIRRVVTVDTITRTTNTLILQGVDEGMAGAASVFGWSLVINTATGKAVFSASGSGIAYVAFGSCRASMALRENTTDDSTAK